MLGTVQDIYAYVRLEVNKASNGTVSPTEFNRLINAAQSRWVEDRYKEIEKDQANEDSLRVLIPEVATIANTGALASEGEIFPLPYVQNPIAGVTRGYLHALRVAARMLKVSDSSPVACVHASGFSPCRMLPRDRRMDIDRNPFWRATDHEPYYYEVGHTIRIKGAAGSYASQIQLEYLRHPVSMSYDPAGLAHVQPELQADANLEIARLCARMYIEISQDPRLQSKLIEERSPITPTT